MTVRPGAFAAFSRIRSSLPGRLGAWAGASGLWLLLAGCAGNPTQAPRPEAEGTAPAEWQAPLPHDGRVAELLDWWSQFNDALLTDLQKHAQAVSPTLATAAARISQARATEVAASGALVPDLAATASAARGRPDLTLPLGNSYSAGLQTSWEVDVFGGGRAASRAARARLDGARAGWHEARVSVAAEVANRYLALRACEAQTAQAQLDADSRAETSRLTALSAKAGFQAPATAALARASAAQGNAQLLSIQAQCDVAVKGLVALTGMPEGILRDRLADGRARLPAPAELQVSAVPADVLNQRPDLFISGRELVAASADVDQARAARLPSIRLNGSIGATRLETSSGGVSGTNWSLGPLALTLPLFDAGKRRANVEAARARYDEASLGYRAQVRNAVREVEEALVQLRSANLREQDARTAAEGFEASYQATQALFKGGLRSLFDLEDARRSAVQAQTALIDLQRERVAAWIALYRALGGGWASPDAPPSAAPAPPPRH